METEYFLNTVRAQLNTSATKPCTFFGTDGEGRRVFGKGPFPSKGEAEVATKVSAVKSLLVPGITNPHIELVELIPNGMVDCQYGYRTSCDIDKPHWFQVVRDVMPNEKQWPPLSKNRSSPKAWPEPVKVVDWSVVEKYAHVEYNRVASKSIYKKNPHTAHQFAANIFTSWVVGAGPDLTLSNFLIDHTDGTVMQVDNDIWFNNDWWITNTRVCSTRSKAYDQFKKFVNGHMVSGEFFDKLAEQFKNNKKAIVDIVGVDNAVVMEQKIVALGNDWESAHKRWGDIVVTPVSTKRKADKVHSPKPPKKARAGGDNDEPMPEKIPLVRHQAIPPVVERGYEAFTGDNDIYIGESTSVYQKSTDPWGFSVPHRESDMQKAIRRGDYRQAMVAFFACYNLSRIFPGDTNAKLIRTNVLNRLVMCAVEDIGVANVMLVNLVAKVVDDIIEAFKKDGNSPNQYIKNFVELGLANILYQMCICKKTRIQSHLAHAYHDKNAYMSINQFGLKWNYKPTSVADPNFIRVVQEDQAFAWSKFRGLVHESIYKSWKRMKGKNRTHIVRYVFTALHYSQLGTIPTEHLTSINHSNTKIPERYKLNLYFENKIKEDPKEYGYNNKRVGCYITNEDARFNNRQFKQIYEVSKV